MSIISTVAFAAFLSVTTLSAADQLYCSQPRVPRYGYIDSDAKYKYYVGSTIVFKCWNGYQLQGHSTHKCLSRGNYAYWNFKVPVCIKIRQVCDELEDPEYGEVSLSGINVGAKARYSCDKGFQLQGNKVRRCKSNGQWSGSEPFCKRIATCQKLSSPQYGEADHDGFTVGSKATYSCDSGFKLRGNKVRKCKSNGQWSGSDAVCIKKITCQELSSPQYGDVKLSGVKIGSKATYSCDSGFKLRGNKVRKCQSNGQWSGSDAVCIKKITCQELSSPQYGDVKLSGVKIGSKATYSCDRGFKLQGNRKRKCQSNGQWSGSNPVCIGKAPVQCKPLPAPKYGYVNVAGFHVGAKAYYSCQKGYYVQGAKVLSCRHNGHWSAHPPVCVAIHYKG